MKKIISLILALTLVLCCGAVAFAADNNETLKNAILDVMPDEYEDLYFPQAEKIIDQLDITDAQLEELLAIIDEVSAELDEDHSNTLDEFSPADREYLLGKFDEATKVLSLTYTYTNKPVAGDQYITVYDAEGNKLGTVDGDLTANKTDSAVPAWAWVLAVVSVVSLAGGAVTMVRRNKIAE